MFAAFLLTLAAQSEAPPQAEAQTRLEFQTSSALEYWMLTRAAAEGQTAALNLPGMAEAVDLLAGVDRRGRRALSLADASVADTGSLAEAAEQLSAINSQWDAGHPLAESMDVASSALELLAASEASFRSAHWLPRQERLEEFGAELEEWTGPKWGEALQRIRSGLGVRDPKSAVTVYLCTSMPSPGGVTLRAGEAFCVVSLADAEGDLRPLDMLAEIVIHESIHAIEHHAIGTGPVPVTRQLRQRLAEQTETPQPLQQLLPHAWIFALGDSVMRDIYQQEGPLYAEREGIYDRMGETAQMLRKRFAQLSAQASSGELPWNTARSQLIEEVLAFTQRERRPNILLILADDQGWADFSYLGLKDDVSTPHLDKLAAQGVTMPQAYASSPICNPSRVGLITGRYQQRWNNYYYGGGRGLPSEAITLAERLKTAGYATGYFGKVHTGGPDNGPGKPGFPLEQGFDRFFGTTCGGRVHYLYHSREAQAKYGKAAGQMEVEPMWDDDEQVEWEGFTTVDWTNKAIEFIDQHPDRPWFTFINHNAVHNFAWQLPAEELEARGLEFVPDWNSDEIGYREWYAKMHRRDWPEGRAYYLAQLECLDREVGRLLDHVEARGMADNTLVIYTVDNGGCVPDWADNGPLAGSKYHLLEGGTRVRSFVRMPGVFPEGRVHEDVFSCLDFAPTICELAGIATEQGAFDGRSQVAELQGKRKPKPSRALHWDIGWQWSVRLGDWKLMVTENAQRAQGSSNFEQVSVRLGTHLYHLGEDPGETNNLAESRPNLVALLTSRHKAWRASMGQPIKAGN